ncbi:MAG: ATP-grasp domain-containing protein [Acidobacteriota bacterium]|nr:MAG: ATP-grasp domain-containing protein [Acidobacteriota bacterium]
MNRPFKKILIANRGEIARRVIAACHGMGISTVAVFSDADARSGHVLAADEAVHLGAAPSAESYLNIERIVEAARLTGADAVHPGYGFLSENADFAQSCADAGMVFIGPSVEAIRAMGLKSSARRIAAGAGVPVTPGYDGDEQGSDVLLAHINKIGLPVLIKASAGGGGRGMRVVQSGDDPLTAIESARREAEKAFGDGRLLLEKFIDHARHVEIQILGDGHGNLIHLFERDCSLQRRHQKVIEESPSPALDESLRRRMGEAAVKVGRAIGYTNAGTVEFLLTPAGEFYFIEVNTRLQVEHPVTEMITGLDLVRLQIEVAEGRRLGLSQDSIAIHGHAIEARLYAEDPLNGFLPSTGRIVDWRIDAEFASFSPAGHGLRIDSGVASGDEIGIHYDPLLAKFIAHAYDRRTAIRKLVHALRRTSVFGLKTNRRFLIDLLEDPDFIEGNFDTGFIAGRMNQLACRGDRSFDHGSLVAAALYRRHQSSRAHPLLIELPAGYRNNPWRNQRLKVRLDDQDLEISWSNDGPDDHHFEISGVVIDARMISCRSDSIDLIADRVFRSYRVIEDGDRLCVHSSAGSFEIEFLPRHPVHHSIEEEGSANSPMPGQVLRVLVEAGQTVTIGDPLVVLEAMKIEHTMRAGTDGVIEKIFVGQGDVVGPGQLLIQIRTAEERESDQQ